VARGNLGEGADRIHPKAVFSATVGKVQRTHGGVGCVVEATGQEIGFRQPAQANRVPVRYLLICIALEASSACSRSARPSLMRPTRA
jgi:hypothetical protein